MIWWKGVDTCFYIFWFAFFVCSNLRAIKNRAEIRAFVLWNRHRLLQHYINLRICLYVLKYGPIIIIYLFRKKEEAEIATFRRQPKLKCYYDIHELFFFGFFCPLLLFCSNQALVWILHAQPVFFAVVAMYRVLSIDTQKPKNLRTTTIE